MTYTKKEFRIVFMGTPDFAVASLQALIENGFNVVGVITAPDKPAGRGKKITESAVKKYAKENALNILQPTNLKDKTFQSELKALNANLQVIVAFRMLPEAVWNMPELGSINLHASLLPQYRGAAPINWAVINGDKKTGATTFFLKHEIDTGNIIDQIEVDILPDDNAGTIHDKLMVNGANLLVTTIQKIIDKNYKEIPQDNVASEQLKHAPKIFKDDCKIDWKKTGNQIQNLIRGLSPYPAAWSEFIDTDNKLISFKVYEAAFEQFNHNYKIGSIITDGKTYIKIAVIDGFIDILEIHLAGKKRLKTRDLLQGFKQINNLSINL